MNHRKKTPHQIKAVVFICSLRCRGSIVCFWWKRNSGGNGLSVHIGTVKKLPCDRSLWAACYVILIISVFMWVDFKFYIWLRNFSPIHMSHLKIHYGRCSYNLFGFYDRLVFLTSVVALNEIISSNTLLNKLSKCCP